MTVPVTASSIGLYENSTGALFSSGPASITFGHATLRVVLPSQIPTLSGWALIILAATLAAVGALVSRGGHRAAVSPARGAACSLD